MNWAFCAAFTVCIPVVIGVSINEVADKGSSGTFAVCDGEDWVELINANNTEANITGYVLHDDKGALDEDAYTFPIGSTLGAGGRLLLCRKVSFAFGIGGDDQITVKDTQGEVVDTTGVMGDAGEENKVWARIPDGPSGMFVYSSTPTPNEPNIFSNPPTEAPATTTPPSDLSSSNTQPPSEEELAAPASSCAKLRAEYGLDCNACLSELPAVVPAADCPVRTAEDDAADEITAMFGSKPRQLYNLTSFLFNTDKVWKVELDLSAESWEAMTAEPAKEEYHPGTVRFTSDVGGAKEALVNPATGNTSWIGVGIRFKGYYGSLRMCLGTPASGGLSCSKLSYKMKFDFEDEEQRFFGLKKLQLHASLGDPTKMRERLTYSLFREMGVPAPRSAFSVVELTVGDGNSGNVLHSQQLGVHLLTEVIDGRFTDTYFSGGDGNLFKEVWPGAVDPDGAVNDTLFRDQLKTNEEVGDVTRLAEFSRALQSAKNDYDLVKVVKEFVHTQKWAAYLAVDRAVMHWDGPTNFRRKTPPVPTEEHVFSDDVPTWCSGGCGAAASCYQYGVGCIDGEYQTGGPFAGCKDAVACAACFPESDCGGANSDAAKGDRLARADDAVERYWTHNFYLYEEDNKNVSTREFDLLPWDTDNTWPHPNDADSLMGEDRPLWDAPVCNGQTDEYQAEHGCINCELFTSTAGLSQQMPTSCFKLMRAFARGMRRQYINAAATLLSGPLEPCQVNSKLDRWRRALMPFLNEDQTQGLYPELSTVKAFLETFLGADSPMFPVLALDFKENVVPTYTQQFKDLVGCDTRKYDANAWDEVIDAKAVGEMQSPGDDSNYGSIDSLPAHPHDTTLPPSPSTANTANVTTITVVAGTAEAGTNGLDVNLDTDSSSSAAPTSVKGSLLAGTIGAFTSLSWFLL